MKKPPKIISPVMSGLGALDVSAVPNCTDCVRVSRVGKKLLCDGGRRFESYLVTGADDVNATLESIGIIGIGLRTATFFNDDERTDTQCAVILAAWCACFPKKEEVA